ncbi:MAG: hypothetical protein LBS19_09315 [Clostridiales bacterium]|jgi:hypothetical protein|nr:hypothetical protein [Clostridiales bacterium]
MALNPRDKRRLERAKGDYDFYKEAERAIVGGAQQYSMGSRSVTKAQLSYIQKRINELEDTIDALELPGSRFKRVVPIDQ